MTGRTRFVAGIDEGAYFFEPAWIVQANKLFRQIYSAYSRNRLEGLYHVELGWASFPNGKFLQKNTLEVRVGTSPETTNLQAMRFLITNGSPQVGQLMDLPDSELLIHIEVLPGENAVENWGPPAVPRTHVKVMVGKSSVVNVLLGVMLDIGTARSTAISPYVTGVPVKVEVRSPQSSFYKQKVIYASQAGLAPVCYPQAGYFALSRHCKYGDGFQRPSFQLEILRLKHWLAFLRGIYLHTSTEQVQSLRILAFKLCGLVLPRTLRRHLQERLEVRFVILPGEGFAESEVRKLSGELTRLKQVLKDSTLAMSKVRLRYRRWWAVMSPEAVLESQMIFDLATERKIIVMPTL